MSKIKLVNNLAHNESRTILDLQIQNTTRLKLTVQNNFDNEYLVNIVFIKNEAIYTHTILLDRKEFVELDERSNMNTLDIIYDSAYYYLESIRTRYDINVEKEAKIILYLMSDKYREENFCNF